jgi:uncharacterized integral membrane protein
MVFSADGVIVYYVNPDLQDPLLLVAIILVVHIWTVLVVQNQKSSRLSLLASTDYSLRHFRVRILETI